MGTDLKNKSLDRGITIIELLAQQGDCSLAELHRHSGISKASIRRLLATLVERRLVRRSLADGRYRGMVTLPVSAGQKMSSQHAWVVDVAIPFVAELTRVVEWPSDVHLIAGERMRVLDSTRPLSPFHLYRGLVNHEVNIFGSAAGMCCIAEMGNEAFRRIAAHTKGDGRWGLERYRMSNAEYLPHLEATRRRGYGVRITSVAVEKRLDDGLAAIACPIYAGRELMGAVSLLWPKGYLDTESFAHRYLVQLKDTTREITLALSDRAPKTHSARVRSGADAQRDGIRRPAVFLSALDDVH